MKIQGIVLIALIILSIFKYTELIDISIFILIGIFLLWIVIVYIQVHLKNTDRDTPRPVYIAN